MNFLNNLKIGGRLACGFGIVLLLLCGSGIVSLYQTSRVYAGTEELANDWLPSVQAAGIIETIANDARRSSLRAVLATTAEQKSAQRDVYRQDQAKMQAAFADYTKLVSSSEEQTLFDQIRHNWSQFDAVTNKLLDLSDAGPASFDQARELAGGESVRIFKSLVTPIEADIALNRQGAVAESQAAAAAYHATMEWTSVLIVAALALGIAVAVVIAKSITVPIRRSVQVAESVAQGDLSTVIEVSGKDEMSQLLTALKHMTERLKDVVGQVRDSCESIATGSSQIATGNTDLSQRTEEQAASLEETAASMEQLTATVKQNAENARQGNKLAESASLIATQGGEAVRQIVETMRDISSSSSKVADIIAVIEGIAFQTNILALNAAVEAARAGEQGRGFAVVASEVRALAQRSASAAKEIKSLIHDSGEKVRVGTTLVDGAGKTIDDVVKSVKRVTDLMGEITAAVSEQEMGIDQVNQAVMQMDQVTQQNAALVEEASAAAQSMAAQSVGLRELVAVFKLDGGSASRTVAASHMGASYAAPRLA